MNMPKLAMKLTALPEWIERTIQDIENPVFNYSAADVANALRNMLEVLETTPQSAPVDGEQSFIDEWESRFGFLATHNNPRSIESIDEVACLLITPPPASQERGDG